VCELYRRIQVSRTGLLEIKFNTHFILCNFCTGQNIKQQKQTCLMDIEEDPACAVWQIHHCRSYIFEPELRSGCVKVWVILLGVCEWHPPGGATGAIR